MWRERGTRQKSGCYCFLKSLIDLHGGTFSLKSKLRIGTEVVVTFPPERVVAAMAPIDAPPTQPKQGEPKPERPSILKQPLFRLGTGT